MHDKSEVFETPDVKPLMTMFLATLAGLCVANIYYAQPLINEIGVDLHVSNNSAAWISTVTMLGYALGLFAFVPLADAKSPRTLLAILSLAVAATQFVTAVTANLGLLLGLSGVMAMCSVGAPIIVTLAANMAAPAQRGKVTGSVISGVLIGLLLARVGAGLVASWAGSWREMYLLAGGLALLVAAGAWLGLPQSTPRSRLDYRELFTSLYGLWKQEPSLRARCRMGFLAFAGFSAMWATLALLLENAPYRYTPQAIGLFGLFGLAGAIAAKLVGPQVDKGRYQAATRTLSLLFLLSWLLLLFNGGRELITLACGIVLLDFAVQGLQVVNLATLHSITPSRRAGVTMIYTTTYFVGGSCGAAAATQAHSAWGWAGVCVVGLIISSAVLMIGAFSRS